MRSEIGHLEVRDNAARGRYEVEVAGRVAVLEYERDADRITLIHTAVPAPLEGHGVAAQLARAALDDARARRLAVIPRCPYVAAYIRRHLEYLDLVPERARRLLPRKG
jgi:predicted GNAT family acetyltransferase